MGQATAKCLRMISPRADLEIELHTMIDILDDEVDDDDEHDQILTREVAGGKSNQICEGN